MTTCFNSNLNKCDILEEVNKNTCYKENSEILNHFKDIIVQKNFVAIEDLLSESGEYDIQNQDLETISVGKSQFLNWFCSLLKNEDITSIDIDQCLFCKIGNPVFIINGGSFPRKIKSHAEMYITGLMLEPDNHKVSNITFCYSFLNRENNSVFNNNMKKIKALEEKGYTLSEASIKVLGFDIDNIKF